MKTKVLLFILISAICTVAPAQKKNAKITITGTVKDALNNPVRNAMVLTNGEKTSMVTNEKGQYRIKVGREITSIGMFAIGKGLIEQSLDGRTVIDFQYGKSASSEQPERKADPGDVGVNTGYNSVKEKDLTTPVEKIDGKNKKFATYNSVLDMIQREVPGTKVQGGNIVINDSKNMQGSIPALFVVNGVPVTTVENIPPSTVESIEVLKGSSASIYGSRGYGGVILIKTKIE
jgi:TonB-dependent starch-binding outer membrane protein SusC